MDTRTMTNLEIRNAGMEALRRELGLVGMIRFLQQFETGKGDYSRERYQWLHGLDAETISHKIMERGEDSTKQP